MEQVNFTGKFHINTKSNGVPDYLHNFKDNAKPFNKAMDELMGVIDEAKTSNPKVKSHDGLDNYNNVNPELQQDYDTINEILSLTNDDYQETIIPEKALSLDEILEKISNKGIKSLTEKEKQTLHKYSK